MFRVELNGTEISSKEEFMKEMDKAFGFPPYFGRNWDALWECMNDLYWINDNEFNIKILDSDLLYGKHKVNLISFFEELIVRWEKEQSEGVSNNFIKVEYLN